ncbi:Unknown protein, partial [Striga hermonthica]
VSPSLARNAPSPNPSCPRTCPLPSHVRAFLASPSPAWTRLLAPAPHTSSSAHACASPPFPRACAPSPATPMPMWVRPSPVLLLHSHANVRSPLLLPNSCTFSPLPRVSCTPAIFPSSSCPAISQCVPPTPALQSSTAHPRTPDAIHVLLTSVVDSYRVVCAQLQLTGDARLWWNAYWSMRPGEKAGCTWDMFKELVRDKYYPSYYRAEMERQFLALQQGTRTVDEYEREFTRLAGFAPDL